MFCSMRKSVNIKNSGMRIKSANTSNATIALLVVILLLASSTIYLSYLLYQPKNHHSLADGVSAASQTGNVSSSSTNSITVVGTGEASYTPDEALVFVSVQTQNTTAAAATSHNAIDVTNVINALNGIGVSNSSIKTQGFSLSPNYAQCNYACIPQIIGYSITNSLQVNITSDNPTTLGVKAGQVIDTAVNAGANGISLSFGASGSVLSNVTNEALQNAVASASSQAHAIASSLGVSITGVVSANEGSPAYPTYYGNQEVFAASAAISAPTPIVPGSQTISLTVQVVYSIN